MSISSDAPYQQLAAIKANDETALRQLYAAGYPPVEKFVLQNNGTAADAKDIFQEAFVTMWRNVKMEKFVPAGEGSLHAYLFQIARYKWMDHLRSATVKRTTTFDEKYETLMTFEELNDKDAERLNEIKAKFKKLGENCRELLIRFYYRKQSLKEIAASMEWTEATAKNNKYRCMERLRTMITKK